MDDYYHFDTGPTSVSYYTYVCVMIVHYAIGSGIAIVIDGWIVIVIGSRITISDKIMIDGGITIAIIVSENREATKLKMGGWKRKLIKTLIKI